MRVGRWRILRTSESQGNTGHAEVIRVTYDPAVITCDLLMVFWLHDPRHEPPGERRGEHYRSVIL